ncbi:MAG: CoA transferase [Dehalococcoidia bacterium]
MAQQALSGVRVLDLTHLISGPYCTKLLADYGADVIKIERPGVGDVARRMGPFADDEVHPQKSGLFLHLNTNKRSVTLDLKTATGKKLFFELLEGADVVVESFAPRVMPSLGLDFETLRSRCPRLVMTSISNFGQRGPYRDWKTAEMVTYAMAGPMYATGMPEREPMSLGENVIQFQVGAAAAAATAMALWPAEATGQGDHLDISLFRVQAASQDRRTTMLIGYQYTGELNDRRGAGASPAVGVRPCADGYVNIMASAARFENMLRMMGQPELAEDPRFADLVARSQPGAAEEFDTYYIPYLMQHTKRELFQTAQRHHLPSGPLYDSADLLADSHFQGRGFWATVDQGAAGTVTQPGRPFIMEETPWRLRRPAPGLGQHNEELLTGLLGYDRRDLVRLQRLGVI